MNMTASNISTDVTINKLKGRFCIARAGNPDITGSILMTSPGLAFTSSRCRLPELRGYRFFAADTNSQK
jgi:hypothetical protein